MLAADDLQTSSFVLQCRNWRLWSWWGYRIQIIFTYENQVDIRILGGGKLLNCIELLIFSSRCQSLRYLIRIQILWVRDQARSSVLIHYLEYFQAHFLFLIRHKTSRNKLGKLKVRWLILQALGTFKFEKCFNWLSIIAYWKNIYIFPHLHILEWLTLSQSCQGSIHRRTLIRYTGGLGAVECDLLRLSNLHYYCIILIVNIMNVLIESYRKDLKFIDIKCLK